MNKSLGVQAFAYKEEDLRKKSSLLLQMNQFTRKSPSSSIRENPSLSPSSSSSTLTTARTRLPAAFSFPIPMTEPRLNSGLITSIGRLNLTNLQSGGEKRKLEAPPLNPFNRDSERSRVLEKLEAVDARRRRGSSNRSSSAAEALPVVLDLFNFNRNRGEED
ncbi:hypothetical protein CDL15_Pgr004980 [Punica granatum]|uniref:Uncharacterized protein n=1 Tax=Punica granatum TaxID=22663 RepID=A0A218WWA7_PUNGR|nr:hypothetical protein CDL15_Pgr004980 [Punica granatum]